MLVTIFPYSVLYISCKTDTSNNTEKYFPKFSDNIDVSSHRLKSLHLHHYSDSSPTVNINCENLRPFKYSGTSTPSIIRVNSSSLREIEHNLFNDYQIINHVMVTLVET